MWLYPYLSLERDVYKIYTLVDLASPLLAIGYSSLASVSFNLAFTHSLQVGWDHSGCVFSVHKGFIHASSKSARRLNTKNNPVTPHSIRLIHLNNITRRFY
jgi:hypothetical protein